MRPGKLVEIHCEDYEAIVQRLLPTRLECAAEGVGPALAFGRLGRRIDRAVQHGEDLRHGTYAIERRQHRLDNRRRDGADR